MLLSNFSIVRALCSSGAAALPKLQQLSASACRHLSQLAAQSSSSWNHSPHQLPPLLQPALDIPRHDIEEGLPEVTAWLRQHSGTNFCSKLRKGGHTPCVLFSLPGNQAVSLAVDSRDAARLVRQYGRNGLQAQVLRLNIQQAPPSSSSSSSSDDSSQQQQLQQQQQQQQQPLASVRVLPKEVHMNSVSLAVENFRFMFCPPDQLVTVETPVKVWNADIAPGVKAGGWLHLVNRTVPLLCEGWAVQPHIELDVRHMRVKDVVRFSDVPLPRGCKLKVTDPLQPVVRCAARVGGD